MSIGSPDSRYWIGPRPREVHRLTTSRTEVGHLALAFAVLTGDIVLLQVSQGRGLLAPPTASTPWAMLILFGAAAALTGFLFHELAHKIVAQRRGLWAEFRASPMGLLFSFITASIGFLFAAPGATVVDGFGDLKDWGAISIAGPLVNLVAGGAFFGAFWFLAPLHGWGSIAAACGLLAFINGWFATFNLIPFGPLDGRKVLRWSAPVWVGSIVISGALAVLAYYSLYIGGIP